MRLLPAAAAVIATMPLLPCAPTSGQTLLSRVKLTIAGVATPSRRRDPDTSVRRKVARVFGLNSTGPRNPNIERGLLSVTADTPPSCEPTCVDADFIADGHIDGADLAVLLQQWGPATAKTVADLDGDGVVGPSDLGIVLSFWGTCE